MFDLLVHNAAQLVTVDTKGAGIKRGGEMRDLGVIEDGAVGIEDGVITYVGPTSAIDIGDAEESINASGRTVLPGFVDSHTHLVFAGHREHDFARRAAGATYAEIAAAGGGINTTVKATRAATQIELLEYALHRLDSCLQNGTTTVEIKSGYGLDFENEVKMLEVIRELQSLHVVDIVPTFLGAHTVPFDYLDNREEYVRLVVERMIPYVAENGLAGFCDAFMEKTAFNMDETRSVFDAARRHGMKIKLHADQITSGGGAGLAAEMGAVSADHLDRSSADGLERMLGSGSVAVLLPGVSLFLGEEWPNARKFIECGLPVAVATDMNPGSCMSENIQLMASLAVTRMHMTMEEALSAVTINGAAALDLGNAVGSLETGKKADLLVFDTANYKQIPYHFGVNHLMVVVKDGRTVLEKTYAGIQE
jgi:imidazolonepropionase